MNAITTRLHQWWVVPAAGLAALIGCGGISRADNIRMPATSSKPYQQECASCHTAYPPGLLPAESWGRILGSLDKHYGTDASLDAQTTRDITQWLRANAATSRRAKEAPAEDRITRSAWFAREHRKISADVWKRPSVRSTANCSACHAGADQGRFNEHEVRVPR
jgi:nitrate/TMAO reductase-like tetraheme cytochrome c subunit